MALILLGIIGGLREKSPEKDTSSNGPFSTVQATATLEATSSPESSLSEKPIKNGFTVLTGEVIDANPNGGVDGKTLVLKVKIQSLLSNKQTIQQNFHNVADIIKNQGGTSFSCIDYWAVADMSDGQEQKLIAFTVDSDTIQAVASDQIVASELKNHVNNLFIHPSLEDGSSEQSLSDAVSLIETVLEQGFGNNYKVEIQDNMIIASAWTDGVAADATAIQQAGGGSDHESWFQMKEGMKTLYNSLDNLLDSEGYKDTTLVLNVLNDLNHDNVLLTMADGVFVYDLLAE